MDWPNGFWSIWTYLFKHSKHTPFVKPHGFGQSGIWSIRCLPCSWAFTPGNQQHAALHHAVWQLGQEVTRPKTRFEPTSSEKSGVDGHQVPTYLGLYQSVRPDLAKFGHFGKILSNVWQYLRDHCIFGKMLTIFWQIFKAIGHIFVVVDGQM